MLRCLLVLLRRRRALTAEDEAAYQEGKRLRQDLEALRTGSLDGPQPYTHGGRESKRG